MLSASTSCDMEVGQHIKRQVDEREHYVAKYDQETKLIEWTGRQLNPKSGGEKCDLC